MPPRETDPRSGAPPLDVLFRNHAKGLSGAVRSVLGTDRDVAEVLQEAFLKAWRSQQRGTVPRDPVAWIFVLTLNLAKDLRRRQWRRRDEALEETAMEPCTKEPLPDERLHQREAVAAAQGAIRRLQDQEKEIFLLRVSGGLTFPAAAEALGIPVGTAKTRMRSALQRLRCELARFAPDVSRPGAEPLSTRDRRTS